MAEKTLEQQARDLLERLEHPRAQQLTAGDVVELANLIGKAKEFDAARSSDRTLEAIAICDRYDTYIAARIREELGIREEES